MRLLILSGKSPLPDTSGSRRRILRLIEGASQSHDVRLVIISDYLPEEDRAGLETLDLDVDVIQFQRHWPRPRQIVPWLFGRALPLAMQGDLGPARAQLRDISSSFEPDLIWSGSPFLALAVGQDAARTRVGRPVPIAIDVPHIERHTIDGQIMALGRRLRAQPRLARQIGLLALDRAARIAAERRAFESAAILTACSEIEADAARAAGGRVVTVVPNGVDLPTHVGWDPTSRQVLFVGNLGYSPNFDAAERLITTILPKLRVAEPTTTVRIVGAGSERLAHLAQTPGVVIEGFVPSLDEAYRSAGLVIAPLLSGSGTKLKVLEAMAHGVPVVTTPVGAAGLGPPDRLPIAIGKSDSDIVDHACRLFADPSKARGLSKSGRQLAEAKYSWLSIGSEFADSLGSVASERLT